MLSPDGTGWSCTSPASFLGICPLPRLVLSPYLLLLVVGSGIAQPGGAYAPESSEQRAVSLLHSGEIFGSKAKGGLGVQAVTCCLADPCITRVRFRLLELVQPCLTSLLIVCIWQRCFQESQGSGSPQVPICSSFTHWIPARCGSCCDTVYATFGIGLILYNTNTVTPDTRLLTVSCLLSVHCLIHSPNNPKGWYSCLKI